MKSPGITLDVDLDAGFKAVAGQQLAGSWQVPAELARTALAHGAREVDIKLRRNRVVVDAPGAVVPVEAIESLAVLLRGGDPRGRLQALTSLERLDSTSLGWAVGTRPHDLRIEQRTTRGGMSLVRTGHEPAVLTRTGRDEADRFRMVLVRSTIQKRQAVSWIRTACRFSDVLLRLNGEDLRESLRSGCFRARLKRPFPMTVALGVALESPRLWLMRHGILETRVTVPGWPAFEAAVEMAGEVDGWTSSADLRRILSAHLPEVFENVVGLLLRVVPRFSGVSSSCRSALATSLLTAVEKKIRRDEVFRAPLFELVEDGVSRWVSLDDLDQMRDVLPAVVDDTPRIERDTGPLLRLGTSERMRIATLLGVGFFGVPRSRSRFGDRLRDALGLAADSVGGLFRPSEIPEHHLDPAERTFQRRLAAALLLWSGQRSSVLFVPGTGRIRHSRASLRLPRENPVVRACVDAVSRDSGWLYPVARALGVSRLEIHDSVYTAWICDDGQAEPQFQGHVGPFDGYQGREPV